MSSPSGVRGKRTGVSRPVAKLHNLYRCCLVRRTPCACSHGVDDSVRIVVVRQCIVVSCSDSAPRLLLGMGGFFQYSVVSLELNGQIYRECVQVLDAFFLACAEFWKNS